MLLASEVFFNYQSASLKACRKISSSALPSAAWTAEEEADFWASCCSSHSLRCNPHKSCREKIKDSRFCFKYEHRAFDQQVFLLVKAGEAQVKLILIMTVLTNKSALYILSELWKWQSSMLRGHQYLKVECVWNHSVHVQIISQILSQPLI